jgi:nitrogen fixation/metabolism regulation signal transduction histidine kinase
MAARGVNQKSGPMVAAMLRRRAGSMAPSPRRTGSPTSLILREVMSAAAHELSQPLNVMRMTGDAVEDLLTDERASLEKVGEKLTSMTRQLDRAAVALNHLRDFGHHRGPVSKRASLKDAMMGAATLFECQLRSRNIDLVLELPAQCREVAGAQGRLQEVIVGLIICARDAVEACARDEGRGAHRERIVMRVEDSPSADVIRLVIGDVGGLRPKGSLAQQFQPSAPCGDGADAVSLADIEELVREDLAGEVELEATGKETRTIVRLPVFPSQAAASNGTSAAFPDAGSAPPRGIFD